MSIAILTAALLATLPAAALGWFAAASLSGVAANRRLHAPFWRGARWLCLAPLAAAVLGPIWRGIAPVLSAAGPAAGGSAEQAGEVEPFAGFVIELTPVLSAVSSAAPADWPTMIGTAYAAGLAVCLTRLVARRRALARLLGISRAADARLRERFERAARRVGLDPSRIRLRIVDRDCSPFVAGLRPVIVLPAALTAPNRAEAADFALLHELVHIRRGDERDRIVGEILGAALWFNPILALIEARLAVAREFACDADVLDLLSPTERQPYARALLNAGAAPMPRLAGTAFLPSHKRIFQMRIQSILTHSPGAPRRFALLAAAGVFAFLAAPLAAAQVSLTAALGGLVAAEETRAFSPEIGARFQRALELNEAEQYEAALAELDDILASASPDAYEASMIHRVRASAFFEIDDLDGAVEAFQAAVEAGGMTAEETRDTRINLGQLLIATDRVDEGLEALENAVEGPQTARPHLARLMAQAYSTKERWDEALPYAERYMSQTDQASASDYQLLMAIYGHLGMEAEEARAQADYDALGEDASAPQ